MLPGDLAALVSVAVVAAVVVALFAAHLRWRAASQAAVARLLAEGQRTASQAGRGPARAAEPPACVRRYLARALPAGAPPIVVARIEQEGEFRLGDAWKPFRASQVFTAGHPGFVWDARIRVAPGLSVRVRDGYVGGQGFMHAALLAIVTVARAEGTREMAVASLQRWLAETIWFPQALAHDPHVEWTPVDDHSVRVTRADGTVVAGLDFHFTPEGDIERVFTPARYREEHGRFTTMPWGARVLAWQQHAGVRIASEVEVGWYEDGVFAAFYRGRVTRVSYDARPA
jgi:hypothetical protein